MKYLLVLAMGWFLTSSSQIHAQELELEKIMMGYQWVGHSPKNPLWSVTDNKLYFQWNPENNDGDSLYQFDLDAMSMEAVPWEDRQYLYERTPVLNQAKTKAIYAKHGDLFLVNIPIQETLQITNTLAIPSSPHFSHDGKSVLYIENGNLFSWHLAQGYTTQVTQFVKGKKPTKKQISESDEWLKRDQRKLLKVLNEKNRKDSLRKARNERLKPKRPLAIYLGRKSVSQIKLSPNEKFITYQLSESNDVPNTIVMDYVTSSGYATSINARSKVGNITTHYTFGIYDILKDSTYHLNLSRLPGIHNVYNFIDGTVDKDSSRNREVLVHGPYYSDDGQNAVIQIRSLDNKDRWICLLNLQTGNLSLLDHQTDMAWVQGPGIGYLFNSPVLGWLPDNRSIWFQSEKSGYSHLYTLNTSTKKLKALTSGSYEVYSPQLSKDKTNWYFSSNEVHPGERHFYKMDLKGGKRVQITTLSGRNDVYISPDEMTLAILNSQSNQPWELYIQPNTPKATASRITQSQSKEFMQYPWRTPEYISFKASDGAQVPARLYQPLTSKKNGAGIIFVHGAGYLQNAHKWWSSYYREYMFHNLLVDEGYTVLDIDYRGSAGYGRAWRTGIYQFMGGKDLSDQIDGAKYLVEQHELDGSRLGIYGGSYGGFITLMAMFTEPDVFAAGAALRSVTDWAHYNHPYTSNILNQPKADSLAFVKSSPIYHAEGLKGALLMLHGVVDRNVQVQDVVRLSQRLIELKKENWELALYPMEGHGFREPSSWYDEYRRIHLLFKTHLNNPQ